MVVEGMGACVDKRTSCLTKRLLSIGRRSCGWWWDGGVVVEVVN